MGRNVQEQEQDAIFNGEFKYTREKENESEDVLPRSLRPTSMVMKKVHTVIPAHLVAEAISTLHGVIDLRWSGPITPTEMQYVQQYVFAKYPEYSNGLLLVDHDDHLCSSYNKSSSSDNDTIEFEKGKKKFSKSISFKESSSSSLKVAEAAALPCSLNRIQLETSSRLQEILNKKTSIKRNFISIPEIQVRNRALQSCGLTEEEYLVVFTPNVKEATMMIGESYPFFKGNYFMTTIIVEEYDNMKAIVMSKDCKVIIAPETWLDLRIKGSKLSQYFRSRKCKYNPKGLFAYYYYSSDRNAAGAGAGIRCYSSSSTSMHWISEAHRNNWHVLIDATSPLYDFVVNKESRLSSLGIHRPDFVLCAVENNTMHYSQPSKIICLLVRKMSFYTSNVPSSSSSYSV